MPTRNLPVTIFVRALSAFALLLALANPSAAQIDTGAVVGTVRDSSGAAVPKAVVTITNGATGVKQSVPTNDAGEYQFTALPPGTYSVRVNAPGFGPQEQKDIELHVQSRPSVDFSLKVGAVTETVQVQSAGALLQTQSADVGGVVQERQIRDLPLNGRRYADLALLEPGIQKNLTNPNNTAPDRFSSNGNLETQNYFSLDGVDNNSGSTNLQEGSVQTVQPPPDALQEFRVQTRTYSAEFGTSAGAVINASMKSGTNAFHGDVWEFLRNSRFDSNSFFNNAGGVPRGHFSQNQFGGTIGGPIIKNKTFFFFDAQNFTSRKATTVNSAVPTPLMKQGNFTELKASLANPTVPSQNGCITGNIIATEVPRPGRAETLRLISQPEYSVRRRPPGQPGSWTGAPNYQYQYSVPNDTYSWDTRVDHNITDEQPRVRPLQRLSRWIGRIRHGPAIRSPATATSRPSTGFAASPCAAWTDLLRPPC